MSEQFKIIEALNKLTGITGRMEGKFYGLERYIEEKTDNCSKNYELLSNHMEELTNKLNTTVMERRAEKRIEGRFKKILYNRITLLCTVIGLAIAITGLQTSNTKKSDKKLAKISQELRQIKTANANLIKEKHKS
jgi:hypothetical protein